MRFIKYLIIVILLIFAASTILSTAETSISEYIDTTNQSLVRFKLQLPTVFKYISIYSVFILVLLGSYLFLDMKCNTFIRNLISKLDESDHSIWHNNKSFTGIDPKSLLYLSLFSLCVVAVRNWSSVLYGYFKYDDFEFFSTNRTEPLLSLLVTTHGDHLLPLFRLEVALMNFLFGVNPIFYNLFVSALFVLIIIFAGLLLREMKTSCLTVVLYAILCIGWINWGEIAAGYFCVSVYVQIALLSMISIWSYFRWVKTSDTIYKAITTICVGSAIFIDISGAWVPLGVIVFALGEFSAERSRRYIKDWLKSNQWLLTAIVTLYSALAILNVFVFYISRRGSFLSMSGYKHTLFSFLSQLFYLISGGLLISPLFPIGSNLLPTTILVPLLLVLFVFSGLIIFKTLKNTDNKARRYIISILLIIFTTATIVAIGRPMPGFKYAFVAKYTGVLYLWFCLLVCLIWNHYWQRHDLPGKCRMANISLFLLLFFIGHQLFFDKILFLSRAEATGYSVNIDEARTRKNSVEEIRQRLILPLLRLQLKEYRLPSLDGKYLFSVYPSLFKYNLSHYMDFLVPDGQKVVLYKNKAMQGWAARDVATVTSLRSNTDSEFIELLENSPYIQLLYLSPIELSVNAISDTTLKAASIRPNQLLNATDLSYQPNGSMLFSSDGAAELIVDQGNWDPEDRHLLLLNVSYRGTSKTDDVKFDVHFNGVLKIPYNKNYFIIPSGRQSTVSIDLLQIHSYSLNPRVGSLRIFFPVPGKYLVSGVNLI